MPTAFPNGVDVTLSVSPGDDYLEARLDSSGQKMTPYYYSSRGFTPCGEQP